MQGYVFNKKCILDGNEARQLKTILDLEERTISTYLAKQGDTLLHYTSNFDNGYNMDLEVSVSDVKDGSDKAYIGVYLYNIDGEEVDNSEDMYSVLKNKYTLKNEFGSSYNLNVDYL